MDDSGSHVDGGTRYRKLPVSEYVDKMKAGWIGQMAGVGWGGPTEFGWQSQIIPQDKMPSWTPDMINQFLQDDLYVQMTFVRSLELHGLDVSIRQAGIDFANSGYPLWHANNAGRANLWRGIAPPDSGHPKFNSHADDIDYQIEADFAGLISPGLPDAARRLGEKFGRLMNYGDGLYGGQFVSGMYAEAFFETDMKKVIHAGLKCIPGDSQYHECVSDALSWYEKEPEDWQAVWRRLEDKYQNNKDYRRGSCLGDGPPTFNIDAKLNGAYIALGLLYGKGDLDETIVIATRCGQDSDCNPCNAGGVLFTSIGYSRIPEKFTSGLDREGKFSHTPYNFPTLIDVCEKLNRHVILKEGGRIEEDTDGRETLVIPVQEPEPGALETCWEPGPIANSRFTEEEMKMISVPVAPEADVRDAVERFAPGWTVTGCGIDMEPGIHDELRGRKHVLLTHPRGVQTPCVLSRRVAIPAKSAAALELVVGHHELGDWILVVTAGDEELLEREVGPETAADGWLEVEVDLSRFAGSEIELAVTNKANGWACEAAYWATIKLS
jgi:hypothetical protein